MIASALEATLSTVSLAITYAGWDSDGSGMYWRLRYLVGEIVARWAPDRR
jgi:hypothetical protein